MAFDENKPEPISASDTPNKTKFNAEDVSEPKSNRGLLSNRAKHSRKAEFELLDWMNQNRGERSEKSNNRSLKQMMDRKQRFDAIASQLDLTTYQRKIGRELRNSKSLRKMGSKDEYTAFCLCVFIFRYGRYASRTPEKKREIYHPSRSPKNNNQRFVQVADEIGLEKKEIKDVMERMADRLPAYLTWYSN